MKELVLYFDNYITNVPMTTGINTGLDSVRAGCEAYRMPDKLSVAMYTLASYAKLGFSNALIRYELQDASKNEKFESYVRGIFPDAKIIRGRSDSRAKFLESARIMKDMGENWVFYSGNADHPFIANSTHTWDECFKKTRSLRQKYHCVVFYNSHFQEHISSINPKSYLYCPKHEVMEESLECAVIRRDRDPHGSQAILPLDLFTEWFSDPSLEGKRIVRTESIVPITGWKKEESIMVIPKKELCRHFDGYSHVANYGGGNCIDSKAPPLFIPQGFFEGKIRIAYGYPDYREGWVNINPLKENYSFRDPNGTDLKISLEDIPLFWKGRIDILDVNPEMDKAAIASALEKESQLQLNCWPKISKFEPINRLGWYYWRLNQIKNDPNTYDIGTTDNKTVPMLPVKRALLGAIRLGYKAGIFRKKGAK